MGAQRDLSAGSRPQRGPGAQRSGRCPNLAFETPDGRASANGMPSKNRPQACARGAGWARSARPHYLTPQPKEELTPTAAFHPRVPTSRRAQASACYEGRARSAGPHYPTPHPKERTHPERPHLDLRVPSNRVAGRARSARPPNPQPNPEPDRVHPDSRA
ncbi:hypothetical protein JCM33774_37290 [Actinophytocola sp. KF-1]